MRVHSLNRYELAFSGVLRFVPLHYFGSFTYGKGLHQYLLKACRIAWDPASAAAYSVVHSPITPLRVIHWLPSPLLPTFAINLHRPNRLGLSLVRNHPTPCCPSHIPASWARIDGCRRHLSIFVSTSLFHIILIAPCCLTC
jgi:hypothetical protein